MPRLAGNADRIDVWPAFYGEIADQRLCARLRELLNESERWQEFRSYSPTTRNAIVRVFVSGRTAPSGAHRRLRRGRRGSTGHNNDRGGRGLWIRSDARD
jgi:hypothetical protein